MVKIKRRVPIAEVALKKVYPYLVEYQKKNDGRSPTLREVAKRFGYSHEWVRWCYKELVKQKLIEVTHYRQRGVIITK